MKKVKLNFSKVKSKIDRIQIKKSVVTPALASIAIILSVTSISLSLTTYIYRPTKTISNLPTTATVAESDTAKVIAAVSPSVVSIMTETSTRNFFGQQSVSSGAGTGFILSHDGYVVTNKHVVDNSGRITVMLSDGTRYENVPLVDADPNNDIAFLKIPDVNNLSPVKLGDSKALSIGQSVIAIGNALGTFQNTVTTGIVSGVGRSITASDSTGSSTESLIDMIQTDASINQGNSGGPLINSLGEVIGVNTAVSQAGQGIGFAIPISSIKGVVKQLLKTGKVQRAYLGVYSQTINSQVAKKYNLPINYGAYVFTAQQYSAIIKNSPADKAGLKDKDIITAINGVQVGKNGSVSSLIGEYSVGDTIDINVLRDGKEMSLKVTLEAFPRN